MRAALALLACCALVACHPTTGRKPIRHEINGTREERVAQATTILAKYCRLPGPLLDAHMAEDVHDNSGGWVPGPSDSSLSGVIDFPAADLPRWREVLSPRLPTETAASLDSPIPLPSWWPGAAAFADGECYAPQKLTGRHGGFVVLSPSGCTVYFSVF